MPLGAVDADAHRMLHGAPHRTLRSGVRFHDRAQRTNGIAAMSCMSSTAINHPQHGLRGSLSFAK